MARAKKFNGANAAFVEMYFTGSFPAHRLDDDDVFFLHARHGTVQVHAGDWVVEEDDGGFVRLSPDQMKDEYPELMGAN